MSPWREDSPAADEIRFQARIATARALISAGELDPHEGLMLVVWPTAGVLAAEACVSANTAFLRARKDAA